MATRVGWKPMQLLFSNILVCLILWLCASYRQTSNIFVLTNCQNHVFLHSLGRRLWISSACFIRTAHNSATVLQSFTNNLRQIFKLWVKVQTHIAMNSLHELHHKGICLKSNDNAFYNFNNQWKASAMSSFTVFRINNLCA